MCWISIFPFKKKKKEKKNQGKLPQWHRHTVCRVQNTRVLTIYGMSAIYAHFRDSQQAFVMDLIIPMVPLEEQKGSSERVPASHSWKVTKGRFGSTQ